VTYFLGNVLFASFSFETAMLRGTSYSSATGFTSVAASSELLLRTVSLLEEFFQFLQLGPGSDLEVECLMRAAVIADVGFPAVCFQICAEMIELCEEITVVGLQTVSELVIRTDVQHILDTVVNEIDDTSRPTAQTIAKEICIEIIERMLASCTTRDSPILINIPQSDVSDEFVVPLTLDMNDEPFLHTEMVVEIVEITFDTAAAAAESNASKAITDASASLHLSQASVVRSNVAASCSELLLEDPTTLKPGSELTGTQVGTANFIPQAIDVQHLHSQPQAGTEQPDHFALEAVVGDQHARAAQLQCGDPMSPVGYDAVPYEHGDYQPHGFALQEGTGNQEVGRNSQQYLTDERLELVTAEKVTPYVAPEVTGGDATLKDDQGDQLEQIQAHGQAQLSQPPSESQHCTQKTPDQPQDGEKEQQRQAEEHAAFEKLWQTEKTAVEQRAEVRATVQFRQWQRDKVTLEAAIEASLRDYGELYEKVIAYCTANLHFTDTYYVLLQAHALRLQFEAEKRQWATQVAEACHKDFCNQQQLQGGLHGAQRWGQPRLLRMPAQPFLQQSCWPAAPQSSEQAVNLCAVENAGEFQYELDEDVCVDSAHAVGGGSGRVAGAVLITPEKRPAKKFVVPVRQ
jgi:hypothetical protein